MSPILGIWASQISGHLWAPEGAYDALATITVPSGGVSSISFVGIPNGYKHLQLRYLAKTSRAALNDYAKLEINGDTTTSNYRSHSVNGGGSAIYAENHANVIELGGFPGNTNASIFGAGIMDFLDYSSVTKYKTIRSLEGYDQNSASTGAAWLGLDSGLWMSTSAITSIKITPGTGPNFVQYSQFSLYGVK
jgi:hypothetical protein